MVVDRGKPAPLRSSQIPRIPTACAPLRDRGAHHLNDLPEPERLFQLVADGLPSSLPPPRVHEEAIEAAGLPD